LGKWGHAPQGASTHLIQPFKNTVLSRNLDQIMLKMRIFGKNLENRRSVGGSAPNPPLASGGWRLRPQTPALLLLPTAIAFVEQVSSIGRLLYYFEK